MAQEKLPESRICGFKLSMLTSRAKKELAVKELTNYKLFDELTNPTRGGVYDPALGCYGKGADCETCGLPFKPLQGIKMYGCPGHFGGIKLPLPVYNPYTIDIIKKLLKCICFKCLTFGKKESECILFVKQMDAIKMSLFDVCEKMSDIHQLFEQEYGSELQNKKLEDFREQLDKCFQNGAEKTQAKMLTSYSKNIGSIIQELCKEFMEAPKRCLKCRMIIPKVEVDRQQGIIKINRNDENGDSVRPILSALEARNIFRSVWQNQAPVLMHLCSTFGVESKKATGEEEEYPTDIFFTDYILVMPPRSRPPNYVNGGINGDPSSIQYANIIFVANELKDLIKQSQINVKPPVESPNDMEAFRIKKEELKTKIFDTLTRLQMHVNVQLDKSMCKMLKNAPDGIKQLLERKEGVMRWNVMGKRVNYAARSVISPDPNIACDKVGVPLDIAKKLYITEPVTPRNIEEMRRAVINGVNKYPGAITLTMENGLPVSLVSKTEKQREALANRLLTPSTFGHNVINKFKMVQRHMKDGDMMLLNRQPTLHKPSIQAFQAKVMDGSRTLKINYSACKAFNADFDGDEMNAHLPQDLVSKSEAIHIASATEQFLVPKDGKPIGGLIQDHIVGGVMMTMKGVFFPKEKYQEIVYAALCPQFEKIILLPPSVIKPYELWSGKDVVSTVLLNIIPKDKAPITMEASTKISDMDWRSNQKMKPSKFSHLAGMATKTKVFFYEGIMYSGLLDKSQIGASANGLLHYCYELYGGPIVSQLMSCLAKLFTGYLQYQTAFSMGMDDVVFTKQGAKQRKKCVRNVIKIGNGIMAKALDHNIEDEDGLKDIYRKAIYSFDKTDIHILDASFQSIMNDYQEEIKKSCWPHQLLRTFPHNGLLTSVLSGAKGSSVNCLQISCLLGQVDLEGSRPAAMNSGRTFALFHPFDMSPRAGGFIFGSFCTGLHQSEFFFHCMAGRDGLIDTAVKTSRSGYLQRCLVKLLEGVKVGYDGSIRDHDGSVIQTRYGCDGLDVMKISLLNKKHFTHLIVNREAIISREQINEIKDKVNKTEAESLYKEFEDWKQRNEDGCQKSLYSIFVKKFKSKAWSRVEHLDVPMWKKKSMCSMELSDMFDRLSDRKKKKLSKKLDPRPMPVISTLNPAMNLGCTSDSFREEVESYLKNDFKKSHLIKYGKKKISKEEARDFLNILYQRALINPGEPVGVLAATSIGEQTTQMTLNTFHFAGQNAMNVTLGVPRLREILMTASKNIKTPQITVPLKNMDPMLEAEAEKLVGLFRKVPLIDVLKGVQIKETLCRREGGKSQLKYRAKFRICDPSLYGNEYNITPDEVLRFLEDKFFEKFLSQVVKTLKRSENMKQLISEKQKKEFGPNFGRNNEDGEGDEEDAAPKSKDEDFSDVSDDEQENDFENDESGDEVNYSDNEGEENDEEETSGVKAGSDDDDDDDNEDDDDNDNKDLRKRKIKTEDGRIVLVEETEGNRPNKRIKMEIDDSRVKEVLSKLPKAKKYEYDTQNSMWCILEFHVDSNRITHDLLKSEIENSYICRVPGITNCIMKTIDKDDSPLYMFESAEKLRIENGLGPDRRRKKIVIEGKNLMELVKYEHLLSLDEMYCNDIHLVARTFSINVAKKIIIEEIRQVFKAYNIDLDFRHLYLIADFMSFEGVVMPFNRYGINSSSSIMQKASFETALNFIKNAALSASHDTLECPSSSIAVGKLISTGTGAFELRTPLQ